LILLIKRVQIFWPVRIMDDALDRADPDALGFVVVPDAFGTEARINLVNQLPL
jgi:hypothetical protein